MNTSDRWWRGGEIKHGVFLDGKWWPVYYELLWPSNKAVCIVCGRSEFSDSMTRRTMWTVGGTRAHVYNCKGMGCGKPKVEEAWQKYSQAEVVSYVMSRLRG